MRTMPWLSGVLVGLVVCLGAGARADLVSYWPMNEGSGTTANNAVAGMPNGTAGGAQFGTWITGHDGTGYALDFNGTN